MKLTIAGASMLAFAALNASAANWTLIRRIGQFAGCAASMVDARSTLQAGLAETNPILGSGKPNAGRIYGIKIGTCAGSILWSEYLHHKYPIGSITEKIGAASAFGQAAFYTGAAIHNEELLK
jgi:hypothetical protein